MNELPNGWVETDIAAVTLKASKNDLKNDPDKKIWYIDISSIDSQAQAIESPQRLDLLEAPSRARQIVQTGDVLFSLVRPYLRKIAPVTPEFDGEVASTGFAVLRAANGIDPKLLFFKAISRDFVGALTEDQYGVSYPAVKEEQVKSQPLHLPPVNEQSRIVDKIEKLFAELDKGEESLRTAKARAGLYRQSLLKHAFEGQLTADWRAANPDKLEDPKTLLTRIQNERDARYKQALDDWQVALEKWRDEGEEGKKPAKPKRPRDFNLSLEDIQIDLAELPHGWLWQRLGFCTCGVEYGTSAKSADSGDVPVIRMGNLQGGHIDWENLAYTSDSEEITKYTMSKGDVLFNRTNSPELVGKTSIYIGERPAIFAGYLIRINQIERIASGKYVTYFLNSIIAKSHGGTVKTDGVNQSNINGNKLQEYPFPFCSPSEQAKIVELLDAKLSTLDAVEEQIEMQIARCRALRQSILKRAFAGELVAQDPNDEPASKLLVRIKSEKAETEIAAKRDRKTKPARKPKNRRPTMTDLIEVLKKEGDWVSASKAAQGLGIADGTSSDDVEAFYRQLKERIEANEIEVERRGDEDWLRLAKVEAN